LGFAVHRAPPPTCPNFAFLLNFVLSVPLW
jgi:hypothetical protein